MAETGLCHEKPVFAMVPTSLNPLPLLTPSNPFHISVCYDRLYHPDLLSIFLTYTAHRDVCVREDTGWSGISQDNS